MPDNSENQMSLSHSESPGLYKKAIRGGIWLFALRFFIQIISLGKRVVLLRLLMPSDFGMLGIATLTMAMMASFSEMGFQEALIQKKENAKEYLDVAWTVRLLRGALLFSIIYLAAPFVANFFDSSKPLESRDITRPQAIVDSLTENENDFTMYLAEHLSSQTQGYINEYKSSGNLSSDLVTSLTDDLNRIAAGELIYDPIRFKDIELSDYSKAVLERYQEPQDAFRINKLILQQAYPLEIRVTVIDIPQCIAVVRVLGFMVLLTAFGNIGIVFFAKELDFHKKFYLHASSTAISAVVTIVLAFIYRNVWALVFGRVASNIIVIILSYVMHPYRPRLSFAMQKFKTLWGFGKHMFATHIMKFFCLHGDDAVLGRMLGVTTLGFYQQAYDIGNLVAIEIGNKVSEVGFSVYSKLQDNIEKVRAGYLKSVQVTSLVVFPFTGLLVALAPEIVVNIIGEKWLDMVPAMRILCCFGPIRCMQRGAVFMGLGRPDIIKMITAVRLIIIAVVIYPLTKYHGMVGTSIAVFLPVLVIEPIGYYKLEKLIGARTIDVLRLLSPPVIATLTMAIGITVLKRCFDTVNLLELAVLCCAGALVYAAVILAAGFIYKDYDVIKLLKNIWRGM